MKEKDFEKIAVRLIDDNVSRSQGLLDAVTLALAAAYQRGVKAGQRHRDRERARAIMRAPYHPRKSE